LLLHNEGWQALSRPGPSISRPGFRTEVRDHQFDRPATGGKWTAEFLLVRGHFFSIVFSSSPEEVQQAEGIEIQQVRIDYDPMTPTPELVLKKKRVSEIPSQGWIREWIERYGLSDVYEPLTDEQRKELMKPMSRKEVLQPWFSVN